MKDIVVIGGGVAAVSFVAALTQRQVRPKSIVIVAPEGFGHAPNFHDQSETALCNTSAGVNSLIHEDPHHFMSWLSSRGHPSTSMTCVTRALFGQYLKDTADYMRARLRFMGVECTVIEQEFVSLSCTGSDKAVKLADGSIIHARCVAFCLGHEYRKASGEDYFCYPEDEKRIAAIGDQVKDVVILGTRLSAIDAGLLLIDNPETKVRFISRTGYFPAARQGLPIGQYDTSIIDRIIEQTCDGEVDIYSALINTVKDEIRTHSDVNPCAIDADAELQFAMDVDNCVDGAPVGWQYALDDIMFIMNIVWPHLDEEQQRRLFTENDALIKRYLYSMPERTSLRLRDKIVSGQFSLETGNIVSIDPCDGGGHMLRHAPAADGSVVTEFAPLVIDASGLKKKRLFIQADRTASLTPSPRPMAFACGSFTSSDFEGVHWLGSMVSSLPVVNYIRMIAWHAHLLTTEITSESDSATDAIQLLRA